jgi:hypothetical protein
MSAAALGLAVSLGNGRSPRQKLDKHPCERYESSMLSCLQDCRANFGIFTQAMRAPQPERMGARGGEAERGSTAGPDVDVGMWAHLICVVAMPPCEFYA